MSVEPVGLEAIFLDALEKPAPWERASYLDAACAGDFVLRSRVEALLCAHHDAGSFLDEPLEIAGPVAAPGHATEHSSDTATIRPLPEFSLDILDPPRRPGYLAALGPYDVVGLVGSGGMGVVLKGHDPKLNRTVAIKVLAAELAVDREARRRFLREARAAAAVRHERVVTIYSTEEVRGLPYLVMEHVSGGSLQEQLDCSGPFPAEEVVRIGREVADGLAAAHAQGLVHRDVKPANVLMDEGSGHVKITDFGLARAVDERGLAQGSVLAGTPQYVAPEQAEGGPVDHRSDLFGLGCVLYALCSGRPPFSGRTTMAVIRSVCDDAPQPIAELNPQVPIELVHVIHRLLEKDPARRFGSAAEVADLLGKSAEELQAWCAGRRRAFHSRRRRMLALSLLALVAAVPLWLLGREQAPKSDPALTGRVAEATRDRNGPAIGDKPPQGPASPLFGEIRQIPIGGRLNALVVSPDGRTAYVSGSDTMISVWDLTTGKKLRELTGHENPIKNLAISRDGARLASCAGDRTLRVWDTQSGTERLQLRFKVHVWHVAWSPDGRSILASFNAGQRVDALKRKLDGIDVDNHSVIAFDAATGNQIAKYCAERPRRFYAVAWSADDRHVAAGTDDGSILLFDARTTHLLWEKAGEIKAAPGPRRIGHVGPIHSIGFSRDGTRLYSGCNTNRLISWSLAGRKLIAQRLFLSGFTRFDLSPDETWVAVNGDRGVRLLDLTGRVSDRGFFSLPGHTHLVKSVVFLPGGEHVVSCGWDGTLRVWKLPPRPAPG